MTPTIEPQTVPLTLTPEGVLMVTGTRVPLDTIVYGFQEGQTAEQIVEDFPTVGLKAAYAIIAYYLNNRDGVDAYIKQREEESEEIRKKNEERFPSAGIRERLLARLARGRAG